MKSALTHKLERGQEIFNTETGEVTEFRSRIGTVGETVFIESVDNNGKVHIWTHKQTELL